MATEIKKVYSLDIQGVESVNDLKKAIEQLNDRLKTLNDTSKEYKDTLIELTDYQTKLAEAMRGVTEATSGMSEMSEFLDDFTQGFVEGVNEAIESTDLFDESLLREATSVKELREQIKTLQDALVRLDSGSADYKRTVELLTEKNQKLQEIMAVTKTQVTAAAGSYNALTQELSALRKQWKATSDEAERARIGERMGEINKQLKELDASIGNYQRNVGNYANSMKDVFGNPRKEIRELREQLAHLTVGSEEYNQVLMRMAELTTQQRKFTEQLKYSSSDLGDILGNLGGVARGVAGGFSAMNALMGLVGNQNSDLQKAMLKTQQLMAVVQGLSAMENLKDRINGLVDGIKGFASRFGLLNKSTKEFTDQAKAAGGAAVKTTGALQGEAGVTTELAIETEKLNNVTKNFTAEQKNEYENLEQEKIKISTQISLMKELIRQYEIEAGEIASTNDVKSKEYEVIDKLIEKKREQLQQLYDEYHLIEDVQKQKRAEVRNETDDGLEKDISMFQEQIHLIEEEIKTTQEKIQLRQADIASENAMIKTEEREIEKIKEKLLLGEELTEVDKDNIKAYEHSIKKHKEQIDHYGEEINRLNNLISIKRQTITTTEQEIQKKQRLLAIDEKEKNQLAKLQSEYNKLGKLQLLSKLQKKAEMEQTKALIAAERQDILTKEAEAKAYIGMANASKIAIGAIKGVKAALISSGIGALLVGLGWVLGKIGDGLSNLWDWATGVKKYREEFEKMSQVTARQLEYTERMVNFWKAQGFSDLEIAKKKYAELKQATVDALFEYEQAVITLGEESEEAAKGYEDWLNVQKTLRDEVNSNIDYIEAFLTEIEKTDEQKGMSQLDKDLDEINNKFQTAIDLVKQFQFQNDISASMASEYLQRLNADWDLAIQQAKDKAASATTSTTKTGKSEYEKQKEEADKLYKELIEANKREEQKLKEKYEKEKKLLEKFHKDTTLLTKKYYEDLDKLLTERQKVEYDKWVEHLDSLLKLQKNGSIEYMELEIENLKKIFSADFGADIESQFEDLFDIQILDEVGSKAISITEDIAESMKMMGLDPTNIDDIQKMIDKWNLDKKAIEDAEKALKKYKSELKFTEYENEENAIDAYLDYRLQAIDTLSQEIASKSMTIFGKETGFYTGLSPQDLQNEFEARYAIMETEINKEIELWRAAMEDESLSAEDRNKAIQHYNQAMAKHNAMMVQKQIDANNLLIKSYQNVSNSLASISNSLTSILGSVSDAIMSNAEAQLNAGKITEEAYEEQFYKAKAFQIAQATIQTIAGAVGAFMGITRDTGGWGIAAAAIEAAAVLAAGFAQIAQIRATQPNTGGGSSGGGGGATTFTLPSVMVSEPEYTQNLTSQSDIDALSNALNDQKCYVLESDIRLATEKTNKRKSEVTF